ncbi:putative laccase [Xylogone sp. PMI_703]|nr:putative laccase [Xylogone sp. PMI_703]
MQGTMAILPVRRKRKTVLISVLSVISVLLVLFLYRQQESLYRLLNQKSPGNILQLLQSSTDASNSHEQADGQLQDTSTSSTPLLTKTSLELTRALHPADHVSRPATSIYLDWDIKLAPRTPDGVLKNVFLINDEFPGPTIEGRPGDTLIINVHNHHRNNESISIHWHGLHMTGANHMDGVVTYTQCGIPPGHNFTYQFRIDDDQFGSFWYHAHSGAHRADGLYGGLIIHKPTTAEDGNIISELAEYGYDDERLFLVGDWYHPPGSEILGRFMNVRSLGFEPVPDSFLVNGLGRFNCSLIMPAYPVQCKEGNMPWLQLDKTNKYRFRVVNVGALAGISISISGAKMTVLQVDGGERIIGAEASDSIGILYPGERMDVLVEWVDGEQKNDSFLIITLDPENFRAHNLALTPTRSFRISDSLSPQPALAIEPKSTSLSYFNLSTVIGMDLSSTVGFPEKADKTFVIYTTVVILTIHDNIPMGIVNRTSWQPQSKPQKPLFLLDRTEWDKNQLVPWTGPDPVWVDVVVNNLDEYGHPFHLHGFDFYIISIYRSSYNWGSYNPYEMDEPPAGPFNLLNPLRKDTVYIPRRGYAVLRFRADNEGLWMMHCHVMWHQASGMTFGFQVLGNENGVFNEVNDEKRRIAAELCNKHEKI